MRSHISITEVYIFVKWQWCGYHLQLKKTFFNIQDRIYFWRLGVSVEFKANAFVIVYC